MRNCPHGGKLPPPATNQIFRFPFSTSLVKGFSVWSRGSPCGYPRFSSHSAFSFSLLFLLSSILCIAETRAHLSVDVNTLTMENVYDAYETQQDDSASDFAWLLPRCKLNSDSPATQQADHPFPDAFHIAWPPCQDMALPPARRSLSAEALRSAEVPPSPDDAAERAHKNARTRSLPAEVGWVAGEVPSFRRRSCMSTPHMLLAWPQYSTHAMYCNLILCEEVIYAMHC